jgi:hypothetical protein
MLKEDCYYIIKISVHKVFSKACPMSHMPTFALEKTKKKEDPTS